MRVSCTTVDEFLECLRDELEGRAPPSRVFQNIVRVNVSRRSEDEHGAKYSVLLQASTIVQGEDFEYILEFGQKCGYDYEDSSNEMAGTANAENIKLQIRDFAAPRGLRVMPGILDI